MKRYDMYQDYDMLVKPEEHERGEWVYYDDAQATIARLTAERDEAREKNGALIERAADIADTYRDSCTPGGMQAISDTIACSIRTLATEAETTALAEIIKKAVDAETRACAQICDRQAETFSTEEYAVGQPLSSFSERFACSQVRDAILARLDQRKEGV